MNLGLQEKIALVTGASSGIGAATARIFAEEGADLVVGYGQDEAGAESTARAIRESGRQAWLLPVDLISSESVERAARRIQAEPGALDMLVLCAGRNIITPLEQITPAEWDHIIQVNLNGAFYALQYWAPLIREGGSIVTVASVAAFTGAPHHAHYAAAKAGLVNLTKSAARALAPRLRVNCVSPGITHTPMGEATIAELAPNYAENKILLARYAHAEEIARCIVFIASPVNSFMTGATIDINGGRELR